MALDPGHPARVSWTVGEGAALVAAPRETRYLSDLKTLVTTAEADLRLTTLLDLTIVQGEPAQIDVRLPQGFEIVGTSGTTLEAIQQVPGGVRLTLREPARRRHQLLLNLERASADGSLPGRAGAAHGRRARSARPARWPLEGVGTLELSAREAGSLRRIDVSETSAPLRTLAREPVLAAFRYHRRPDETPSLSLEVKRFRTRPCWPRWPARVGHHARHQRGAHADRARAHRAQPGAAVPARVVPRARPSCPPRSRARPSSR